MLNRAFDVTDAKRGEMRLAQKLVLVLLLIARINSILSLSQRKLFCD